MKTNRILLILFVLEFGLGSSTRCWGQDETQDASSGKPDTLPTRTFMANLDLMFYVTHKEMNQRADFKIVNSAQLQYRLKDTGFALYFRQVLDRLDNVYYYYNHYLNFSSHILRHKSYRSKHAFVRFLHPTPVFIFQNNSARGLSRRFQAGLFFYPLNHYRPKFSINFGAGCLYDWSSWEVNNSYRIEVSPPAMKEKIQFINSHTRLRGNLYMDFSEWRPAFSLNIGYQINDVLSLSFFSSYQQSLVSPFNETIKAAYPELRKVYPYTYSQLSIGAKVYKGISLKSAFIFDYENNNLSIYNSSWEYNVMFGVAWGFPGI